MIRCAALVELDQTNSQILLVRVRDNQLWYLPGGKIELQEAAPEALIRELFEELAIQVIPESISHLTTIISQAYPQNDLVELHCFTADWHGQIAAQAEISAVSYLPLQDLDKMAPAVIKLVDYLRNVTIKLKH